MLFAILVRCCIILRIIFILSVVRLIKVFRNCSSLVFFTFSLPMGWHRGWHSFFGTFEVGWVVIPYYFTSVTSERYYIYYYIKYHSIFKKIFLVFSRKFFILVSYFFPVNCKFYNTKKFSGSMTGLYFKVFRRC